jgi:hypothetical protein
VTLTRSVFALLVFSTALHAQEFRATLAGRVVDSSGAAIPDSVIRATNKATGISSATKSGADGLYVIPFLDPGTYDVQANVSGFQNLKREGIVLEISQRLNLPLQMSVGQMR